MFLYAKDPYEAKCQLLITKRESTGLKYLNDSKTFIEYSNDMDDIYKILKNTIQIRNEEYGLYLISLIKNLIPIVTELFIRGRKLNIYIVFITQLYFAVPKNIRLNSTR